MNAHSAKVVLERTGYAVVEHPRELRVCHNRTLVAKLAVSTLGSVDRSEVQRLVDCAADYLGKEHA